MSIKQNKNETLETTDLTLVTVITLNNFQIEYIDRTDLHRIKFFFKKDEKLNKILEDYWNGKIKVEPKRFFQELKIIKTRIYSNE